MYLRSVITSIRPVSVPRNTQWMRFYSSSNGPLPKKISSLSSIPNPFSNPTVKCSFQNSDLSEIHVRSTWENDFKFQLFQQLQMGGNYNENLLQETSAQSETLLRSLFEITFNSENETVEIGPKAELKNSQIYDSLILEITVPQSTDVIIDALCASVKVTNKIEGDVRIVVEEGELIDVDKIRGEELELCCPRGAITVRNYTEGQNVVLSCSQLEAQKLLAGRLLDVSINKNRKNSIKSAPHGANIAAIYASSSKFKLNPVSPLLVDTVHGRIHVTDCESDDEEEEVKQICEEIDDSEKKEFPQGGNVSLQSVNGAVNISLCASKRSVDVQLEALSKVSRNIIKAPESTVSVSVNPDVDIQADIKATAGINLCDSVKKSFPPDSFKAENGKYECKGRIVPGESVREPSNRARFSGKIDPSKAKSAAMSTSFFSKDGNWPEGTDTAAAAPVQTLDVLAEKVALEHLSWKMKLQRKFLSRNE